MDATQRMTRPEIQAELERMRELVLAGDRIMTEARATERQLAERAGFSDMDKVRNRIWILERALMHGFTVFPHAAIKTPSTDEFFG